MKPPLVQDAKQYVYVCRHAYMNISCFQQELFDKYLLNSCLKSKRYIIKNETSEISNFKSYSHTAENFLPVDYTYFI